MSSVQNLEAAHFSETSVLIYKTTLCMSRKTAVFKVPDFLLLFVFVSVVVVVVVVVVVAVTFNRLADAVFDIWPAYWLF